MPKRKQKQQSQNFLCEFCSAVFSTEWSKIALSASQHSDLNAIVTSIQADMDNGDFLEDVTQFYDPTSMDIILP